jgi:hypothetical protein
MRTVFSMRAARTGGGSVGRTATWTSGAGANDDASAQGGAQGSAGAGDE